MFDQTKGKDKAHDTTTTTPQTMSTFAVPKAPGSAADDGLGTSLGTSVQERYVPHQASLLVAENRSPLLFPHKASSRGGNDGTALTFGAKAPAVETKVPALTPSPSEFGEEMQRREPTTPHLDKLWKMTKAYLPKSLFHHHHNHKQTNKQTNKRCV